VIFYKHERHCGDTDLVELKLDFVFLWRLGEGQRGNAGSTDLGSKPSEWGWTEWRSPVMWVISQMCWAHWELRVRRRIRNKRPDTSFNQGKGTVMLYFPELRFPTARIWWIYLIDKYNCSTVVLVPVRNLPFPNLNWFSCFTRPLDVCIPFCRVASLSFEDPREHFFGFERLSDGIESRSQSRIHDFSLGGIELV